MPKKKIALFDVDPITKKILNKILAQNYFKTIDLNSQEAISLQLARETPICLIMGWSLFGSDGKIAFELLSLNDGTYKIPIVLLVADIALERCVPKAMGLNYKVFIQPYEWEKILATVNELAGDRYHSLYSREKFKRFRTTFISMLGGRIRELRKIAGGRPMDWNECELQLMSIRCAALQAGLDGLGTQIKSVELMLGRYKSKPHIDETIDILLRDCLARLEEMLYDLSENRSRIT